jgi:hypothetical protein
MLVNDLDMGGDPPPLGKADPCPRSTSDLALRAIAAEQRGCAGAVTAVVHDLPFLELPGASQALLPRKNRSSVTTSLEISARS